MIFPRQPILDTNQKDGRTYLPFAPGWILSPLKGERRAEQLHVWLIMHPPQREPRVGGVSQSCILVSYTVPSGASGADGLLPLLPRQPFLLGLTSSTCTPGGTTSMNAGRGAACSVGCPACSSLQGGAVSLRPAPLGPLPTTSPPPRRPSSRCSCTNGGSCAESGEGSTRMPASLPA